ncbi:LOW QUALITY PROTEIN: hypothetical protein Cgig2_029755 [Carnegiea gigantea]|uniref:Uncharacterized protein n=1 Tax=Carnegiea gigantea TaxID=171969 RepID=A0A9Q1H0E3_9CARY|nr:LOW QUALITY PROTEIN: hypothetical protein Cgig2_029755 [Carnegiea gigantea]
MWRTVHGRHTSGGFGNWALTTDGPVANDHDRRGAAFPSSPLPKEFRALCLTYELAVAEEAAEHYDLPELPQVIFYVVLLNEAERFGVLHGRALRTLESALTELHWSIFESWVWSHGDRIFEPQFRTKAELEKSSGAEDSEVKLEGEGLATEGAASPFDDDKQGSGVTREERRQRMLGTPLSPFIMSFPPLYDTREMADYVRESFIWRWRRARHLPRPLPKDYYILCLRFSLPKAERAPADFELPEKVQVTFYTLLLNETVELGVVHGFMAKDLKSSLVGLSNKPLQRRPVVHRTVRKKARGKDFKLQEPRGEVEATEYVHDHFRRALRDPSALSPRLLPSDYHGLCPRFDLRVAPRYAHDSNTPKMVQIIFYAMVIDDATELGLSHRITMDCMIWAMRKLDWALWRPGSGIMTEEPRLLVQPIPRQTPGGPLRGRTTSFPTFRDIAQAAEYVRDNLRWSFAHAFHILEMVQAIFYALVINGAVELRLIRREIGESLMLDSQELRWDIIEAWLLFIEDRLKDA